MTHPGEDKVWLCSFLRQNGPVMTIADLMVETGCTRNMIEDYLERLGIKAPSVMEINITFLRENKGKISAKKAKKILGIVNKAHFYDILREAEMTMEDLPKEKIMQKDISFREVLSAFQKDTRVHYQHDIDHRTIEDILKA